MEKYKAVQYYCTPGFPRTFLFHFLHFSTSHFQRPHDTY